MKYIILYGRQNQSDNVLKSGIYCTRFFAQRKANELNNNEKHDENKYYFVSPFIVLCEFLLLPTVRVFGKATAAKI